MKTGGSIEVLLRGGLGNQMFQYALGRTLSIRTGLPLVFDDSGLGFDVTVARGYELACFRLSVCGMRRRPSQLDRAKERVLRILTRVEGNSSYLIKESSIAFDPAVLQQDRPCRLDGYWQSERYFESIAERLREDFEIVAPQDPRSFKSLRQIRRANAVGLHVRRADYVTNPAASAFHGTCPVDYYVEALEVIRSRLGPDLELFVFSDDMGWARENFRFPFPTTWVDWNQERSYEDIRLMSACRALVIANSAFSWWAGWLNPDPRKLVIAPKRWFRAKGVHSDLPGAKWLVAL